MLDSIAPGSSPCIRGTPPVATPFQADQRFIPVHTGNALCSRTQNDTYSVHPRAYGERISLLGQRVLHCGSSPCIRGTLLSQHPCADSMRFIPVHTGNASRMYRWMSTPTVHPRAYGERRSSATTNIYNNGSSPCIRGTRLNLGSHCWIKRFIPVHTGNACCECSGYWYQPVHPRAYGERKVRYIWE